MRAAVACTAIGLATSYASPSFRHHVSFPAYSYTVALLLVAGDSPTLGLLLKSTASIACTTVLGLLPALLAAHFMPPKMVSPLSSSVMSAVSAFMVAVVPDVEAGLLGKRITMGQIVLICVASFDFGQPEPVRLLLHLVPAAASTAVGVAAALLAVVVPYPRLASHEVID